MQNYDLAGRDAAALPRRCARKVRPLPIGADLHSRHERSPVHEPPCAQAQRLARLRAAAPPWSRRADRVLAAFTANQFGGRRQLRAALAALPPSTVLRPAGGLLAEQERQYAAVAAQAALDAAHDRFVPLDAKAVKALETQHAAAARAARADEALGKRRARRRRAASRAP